MPLTSRYILRAGRAGLLGLPGVVLLPLVLLVPTGVPPVTAGRNLPKIAVCTFPSRELRRPAAPQAKMPRQGPLDHALQKIVFRDAG